MCHEDTKELEQCMIVTVESDMTPKHLALKILVGRGGHKNKMFNF